MREKISNIKAFSDSLERELYSFGAEKTTVRNTLLAVEELLLLYKDKLKNDDTDVKIEVVRGIRIFSVKLSVSSEELSPDFLQKESEFNTFDKIIENSGFSVNYSYSGNINQIEIVLKKYSGFVQNFLFSFKFIKNKVTLFVAFAAHIISIIANLVIPVFTGRLIVAYTDNIILQILITAASLLLMKLVYNIAFSITNVLYSKVSYYSENELRKELIDKMFLIKDDNFDKSGTGTFIQRVTTDLQAISAGITSVLDIFSEGVYYIGVLVATALINIWVFLAEVLTFAVLFLMESRRAYRLEIDGRKVHRSNDLLSSLVIDCVNGITEIKLLNSRKIFTEKISFVSTESANNSHIANKNSRKWIVASSSIVAVLSFMIMAFLGYDLQKGLLTVPTALILFNYYTIIDRPSVALIQRAIDFCKQFNLATERVRNLYEGSEFARETYGNLHIDKLYGDISFENVTFAYNHDDLTVPDNDIINDVNIKINRGETVAFVGKSGCGKSTLLRLLSRQVTCYCGDITIDGYNISDLDCDTLYNNISVISQSTFLFNCSIKDNLLIAKPDATMEELKDVCEKACILEDIEHTEEGFDTELGEKGVRFSGGQRQRLAIARALLKGTDILLLDEATSAMDNITQDKIMKTINNIGKDHTVIIVAHRLSTIKDADKIMFVGNKKILASGTHEELLKTSEDYKSLYQFEGIDDLESFNDLGDKD